MVDENGMAIGMPPQEQGYPQQQQPMVRPDGTGEPSQQDLDQAFPPQQRQPQYPPQRQPQQPQPQRPQQDPLAPAPDASEPRPNTP
jgi:hypothetical protein